MFLERGKRVLTRFGVGEISSVANERYYVSLDQPFAGTERLICNTNEIVVPQRFGVLRIVNMEWRGVFGNIVFLPNVLAEEAYRDVPRPQNEMRFLLDFVGGTFEQSDPLGILVESEFVLFAPWADRWGCLASDPSFPVDPAHDDVMVEIHRYCEELAGISGGITVQVLLRIRDRRILWHRGLCESGWVALDEFFPRSV